MKLTVIAGYFPPEQSADTRLNQDLIYSLADCGLDVTLIVPFPSRGVSVETQQEFIDKKDERISEQIRIIRVGNPSRYQQGLLKRGFSFLYKSIGLYSVAKKVDTDVYLVISTPPFLGYVAAMLARTKTVIYKLEDIFPDSLIHSKGLSEKNPFIRILRFLEKWVYQRVTAIFAISDDLKNTLLVRGVPSDKIHVIYDWVDEKHCYPVSREENILFSKFGLDMDGFYVCYAGNIGLLQNIGTIVRSSEILADKNIDIKFVIIGNGSWKPELDRMLKNGPHENVYCFPMQPTSDIAYVYSLGDIGLVSLLPGITKYALPSKTWDILSAGRPVVCEIDLYSTLCSIVEDHHCGYCVAPGDAEGLASILEKMYEMRDDLVEMGKKGRRYIENNLTRDAAANKYYEKIVRFIAEEKSTDQIGRKQNVRS